MNCNRCGIEMSEKSIERRLARGTFNGRCRDCNAKPKAQVKYRDEWCTPWRGEVDEDFNPIDRNLKPYLPGLRICGHKDCVTKAHIMNPLELERIDISYRTGQKIERINDIMKEAS